MFRSRFLRTAAYDRKEGAIMSALPMARWSGRRGSNPQVSRFTTAIISIIQRRIMNECSFLTIKRCQMKS